MERAETEIVGDRVRNQARSASYLLTPIVESLGRALREE